MAELAPPLLPYFWHVWCWGDVQRKLETRLLDAGFGFYRDGVWYHQKKHAMFLWQLDNSDLAAMPGVSIKEHQFNVRQYKPRKVKKIVDEAQLIHYVVDCRQ